MLSLQSSRSSYRSTFVQCLVIAASVLMSVEAQLACTEPSTAHWWVANSLNTLRWTGNTPATFSVFLANSDTSVLTSKLALVSVQPYYEYSKTVNPGNLKPATGYTIQLTDTLNSSNIYATSETFEIKAQGSPYPPQTTGTPSGSSVSGSNSNSAVSASVTASRSGADGKWQHINFQYSGAIIGGICAAGLLCSVFDEDFRRVEEGTAEGWIPLKSARNRKCSRIGCRGRGQSVIASGAIMHPVESALCHDTKP